MNKCIKGRINAVEKISLWELMNSAWIHFSFPSWADSILENLDVRQRISSGGQHLAFLFFTRSWSLKVWCCLIIFILSLNQNNELGKCFTNIFLPLMVTSSLHWTWESNIRIALFFIHWLKFVLSIYFNLGHHPLGMVNPPGATPLKKTNSPLETTCPEFFRRVWGFINSSQLHPEMLTALIFYRCCQDNHSFCNFMNTQTYLIFNE